MVCMASNINGILVLLMGAIIAVADIYWTYTSYYDTAWLVLGIIILAADAAWLYLDLSMMRK